MNKGNDSQSELITSEGVRATAQILVENTIGNLEPFVRAGVVARHISDADREVRLELEEMAQDLLAQIAAHEGMVDPAEIADGYRIMVETAFTVYDPTAEPRVE